MKPGALFHAIVVVGAALGAGAGCSDDEQLPPAADAPAQVADARPADARSADARTADATPQDGRPPDGGTPDAMIIIL
jgi:hypothetical protein